MDEPIMAVDFNMELTDYRSLREQTRWAKLRETIDTLVPIDEDKSNGWVRVLLPNIKEASRAGTSASSHAKRSNAEKHGWHLQTAVRKNGDNAYLWLRKVRTKK